MHRLRRVVATFRLAVVAGVAGLALLAGAIVVAWSRFDTCGPSALDALDPGCRLGLRLLMAACAVLSIALLLGAISLTLLWRERRERRHRHE